MATKVGRSPRDDDQMAGAGLDGLVAARADVAAPSLVRLDAPHLQATGVVGDVV
jgi:hypothetical protein